MKVLKELFVVLFSVCLLFSVSGCFPLILGAAAGASGVVFIKGKLTRNFDVPVKGVHEATLSALKKLGLFVKEDELNVHSARVDFEFDDGKKGEVRIIALTEHTSKLVVRVGIVGDEVRSRMVLTEIESTLL